MARPKKTLHQKLLVTSEDPFPEKYLLFWNILGYFRRKKLCADDRDEVGVWRGSKGV